MIAGNRSDTCLGGKSFHETDEKIEVGSIGDNSIVWKPSLGNEIVKKGVQVVVKGLAGQGIEVVKLC